MAPPQSGKSFRSLLGIPPSNPTPTNSTLILIDCQNEYDHGALAIHDVASSRAVIGQVLKKYRDAGGDVVHVVHRTPEGAPLFTPGTELAEEFDELRPKGGEEVVGKVKPCAFSDTDLNETLKKLGKEKLAHVCVSATSRIGAELGYDVSVISDGIGDRDIPGASAPHLVETVLAELGDVSATIVKSSDFLK
ncbi:MAG: hypothetical protein LQ338_007629 [Usnochroma carphineum]|nr:MAG: hypothetical protein LQ338_007629 [Usnochroma carphineum]